MTAYRRMFVALVAILIAAWCFWPSSLTTEEKRFVGVWGSHITSPPHWALSDDCSFQTVGRDGEPWNSNASISSRPFFGYWYVTNGSLFIEKEPSSWRRALRPVARRLGIYAGNVERYKIVSVNDDRIILETDAGETWRFNRLMWLVK
jgi:hypothetical protein